MGISIVNLSKYYGKKAALKDASLEIGQGVHGLLGPNGAGKTTLLRILGTLLKKACGEILINGINVEDAMKIKGIIGYMPQSFDFYPNLTVYEIIDYFAVLSGSDKSRKTIMALLESLNLDSQEKIPCKKLSGGMKRRLGIGVAMVSSPDVLLLDEPTAGLDPEEQISCKNLILKYSKGRTVLLSTHMLEDIEMICGNLTVLNKGRVLFQGATKAFIGKASGKVWSARAQDADAPWMRSLIEQEGGALILESQLEESTLFRYASSSRIFENAMEAEPRLEDSYIMLLRSNAMNEEN
jgi:ABC-2 type transport system ATP-binding protein